MDFNKLAGQAKGFMNKQSEQPTNTGSQTQAPPAGGTTAAAPVEGSAPATGTAAPAAGGSAGQEDYGDKAFDFISKKTGKTFDRDTSEKITDGARGAYEKVTGNKVDPKYSN